MSRSRRLTDGFAVSWGNGSPAADATALPWTTGDVAFEMGTGSIIEYNCTATGTPGTWTPKYGQLDYSLFRTAVTGAPPNAQNLGALASGILKQTVVAGVATISIAGSGDYVRSITAGTGISNGGTAFDWIINSTGVVSIVAGTNVTISGTGTVTVNAVTGMTTGSVLFAGPSSVVTQDNANLFWDDTNNCLGIGTNVPTAQLHVKLSSDTTPNTITAWDNRHAAFLGGGTPEGLGVSYGGGTGFVYLTFLSPAVTMRAAMMRSSSFEIWTGSLPLSGLTKGLFQDGSANVGVGTLTGAATVLATLSSTGVFGRGTGISLTDGDKGDIVVSGSGTVWTIDTAVVTNANLRNSGPLSVIGRSANSTGVPADISATAASDAVLRESGSVLGFGTVATGGIANSAVTYAKIQNTSAASVLIGRGAGSGAGVVQEITLGGNLSLSGTVLNTTGVVTSIVAGTNVTVSGSGAITVNAVTGMTTGSVLFSGASSVVTQDNANFFWDNSTKGLGIGVHPASVSTLHTVRSANSEQSIVVHNPNTGTSAFSALRVSTAASDPVGGDFLRLIQFGVNFTTIGTAASGPSVSLIQANTAAAADLAILNNGKITFSIGNIVSGNPKVTLQTSGALDIDNLNAGGIVSAAVTTGRLGLITVSSPLTFSGGVLTLGNSGVTAGTYGVISSTTIDATGRITSATALSLTSGSVVFSGGGATLSQDNANLFWDDANNRLGIGTNTPVYNLDVKSNLLVNTGTNPGVYVVTGTFPSAYLPGANFSFAVSGDASDYVGMDFNAHTSGAVPFISLRRVDVQKWSLTVDNTGGTDSFNLRAGNVLGTRALTATSAGNILLPSLSASGLVKAAVTTGQLGLATAGTDYAVSLVAGTGISVSNASGVWTVTNTGTGTITAVTATTPIVSSGGTAPNITHATSGVTAGTYSSVTVTTYGHVTGGSQRDVIPFVFAGTVNSMGTNTYITTNSGDANTWSAAAIGPWYESTAASTTIFLKFYISQATLTTGTFTLDIFKNNASSITSAITINPGDNAVTKTSGVLSFTLNGTTDTWGLGLINHAAASGVIWLSGVAILT